MGRATDRRPSLAGRAAEAPLPAVVLTAMAGARYMSDREQTANHAGVAPSSPPPLIAIRTAPVIEMVERGVPWHRPALRQYASRWRTGLPDI